MSQTKLTIAMDMIDALAKLPRLEAMGVSDNHECASAKQVIEAARSIYVLPSFCAEMNVEAKKCIQCIVEHLPPPICLDKICEPVLEDFDLEWDTPSK